MAKYKTKFVSAEETKELRSMLKEMFAVDEGFEAWQIDLLENVSKWQGNFTERQAEAITNIYRDVM